MSTVSASLISRAVAILRRGGLVAFPTETVYGLGADASNPAAVARIFQAKGRPSTNPLIVHVADRARARRYAAVWPAEADALAGAFWPGPLTLVLPRGSGIADAVTAGRDSVALRAPDHELALQLLREFDGPLAGPSANRSTRVSPTTAEHVRAEMGDAVDLILDGGPCRVGIESTVIDLTLTPAKILRPGGISREQIQAVIGAVDVFAGVTSASIAASSPGQHAVHYAPIAPAYRFESHEWARVHKWLAAHPGEGCALVVHTTAEASRLSLIVSTDLIHMPAEPAEYANRLYATLRALDARFIATILIEMPPDMPLWAAVRDRLQRATVPLAM